MDVQQKKSSQALLARLQEVNGDVDPQNVALVKKGDEPTRKIHAFAHKIFLAFVKDPPKVPKDFYIEKTRGLLSAIYRKPHKNKGTQQKRKQETPQQCLQFFVHYLREYRALQVPQELFVLDSANEYCQVVSEVKGGCMESVSMVSFAHFKAAALKELQGKIAFEERQAREAEEKRVREEKELQEKMEAVTCPYKREAAALVSTYQKFFGEGFDEKLQQIVSMPYGQIVKNPPPTYQRGEPFSFPNFVCSLSTAMHKVYTLFAAEYEGDDKQAKERDLLFAMVNCFRKQYPLKKLYGGVDSKEYLRYFTKINPSELEGKTLEEQRRMVFDLVEPKVGEALDQGDSPKEQSKESDQKEKVQEQFRKDVPNPLEPKKESFCQAITIGILQIVDEILEAKGFNCDFYLIDTYHGLIAFRGFLELELNKDKTDEITCFAHFLIFFLQGKIQDVSSQYLSRGGGGGGK